jgi:hypothetical protein
VPHALIAEVVAAHAPATRRCRRLPAELTLVMVIAMNLYATDNLALVLTKLLLVVRLLWPHGTLVPATKGRSARPEPAWVPLRWSICCTASVSRRRHQQRPVPSSSACGSWRWTTGPRRSPTLPPMSAPSVARAGRTDRGATPRSW